MASVRYTLRLSPRSPPGDDALASRTSASLLSEALGARREHPWTRASRSAATATAATACRLAATANLGLDLHRYPLSLVVV